MSNQQISSDERAAELHVALEAIAALSVKSVRTDPLEMNRDRGYWLASNALYLFAYSDAEIDPVRGTETFLRVVPPEIKGEALVLLQAAIDAIQHANPRAV